MVVYVRPHQQVVNTPHHMGEHIPGPRGALPAQVVEYIEWLTSGPQASSGHRSSVSAGLREVRCVPGRRPQKP